MGSKSDLREPVTARQSLAVRLQAFRMRKGWNMDRLSEVAGVSRTTVYHLERGDIAKPRASTLYKLAVALEIDPHELSPDAMPFDAGTPGWPPEDERRQDDPRARFDLRTNTCIKAAYRGAAAHFTGWSQQEWDELYSTFGVGGPLTEQGVLEIARKINTLNDERKSLDLYATTDALRIIRESEELRDSNYTVVYNAEWHKGVIGIVASRLTETYYRPTIVLTYSNGMITGSARSVKDFDIYDAVDACSEYLEHFGGHKYAAGLSLKEENLEKFTECFRNYVNQHITKEQLVPEIEIDAEIILRDISSRFFRILRQFAPFGPGNLSPVFTTNGLVDTGKARVVGKNHLKLEVVHPDISGFPFSAIAFQQGHHYEKINDGMLFSASYHIEENEWNGVKSIQLNIKDLKFEE